MLAELQSPRKREIAHPSGWRLRTPTDNEFRRLFAVVESAAGIALNDTKYALVVRRLSSRIRELGLTSLGDYTDLVCADDSQSELVVLLYELKADLATHLATWAPNGRVKSLADVIAFNEANKTQEMPYFGQELFLQAQEKGPLTDQAYRDALAKDQRLARTEGAPARGLRNPDRAPVHAPQCASRLERLRIGKQQRQ